MRAMASQITGVSIVCSTIGSGADQNKHQSSVSDFCVGNSPVTGEFPTQKASNAKNMFPFDDVIKWLGNTPTSHRTHLRSQPGQPDQRSLGPPQYPTVRHLSLSVVVTNNAINFATVLTVSINRVKFYTAGYSIYTMLILPIEYWNYLLNNSSRWCLKLYECH